MTEEAYDTLYIQCQNCDDLTEHEILKGRVGKGNITGTFRCMACGNTFSDTIRIPESLSVKVLLSDGDVTHTTETTIQSNEIVAMDDEFCLDDGMWVRVTNIDVEDGRNVRKAQADKIKRLWVKQFGVLNVKVSVNDGKRTHSLRVEAEPDDDFTVGMLLPFDDFDALVHAIKTKERLLKKGSAEAREITRIYGKIRRKTYKVMDLDDEPFDEDQEGVS